MSDIILLIINFLIYTIYSTEEEEFSTENSKFEVEINVQLIERLINEDFEKQFPDVALEVLNDDPGITFWIILILSYLFMFYYFIDCLNNRKKIKKEKNTLL